MNLSKARRREIETHLAQAEIPLGDRYRFNCFGNTPESGSDLGALVASGQKTATAAQESVYSYYEIDRPEVGDVEIICDFEGNLLAVIEIEDLRVAPFEKVDAEFAELEGEGDKSLEGWRRVHRAFFEGECRKMGVAFSNRDPILCQRFRLLSAA